MLLCSFTPTSFSNVGILGSDVAGNSAAESSITSGDGALQCAGWKAAPPVSSGGLQPPATSWTSSEYNQQQERAPQTLAYSATADVYMQTLCPSYTMLTYTHAPLLTNFGVSRTGVLMYACHLTKQSLQECS